jgi:hypothetical protein
MTWPVSTCVCPLFVFFDVEPEAYKLQIRYLINYVRIEVREIRTMKLMHGIYIHIYTYIHIYIYILYIYYAPGCILYRECTQAQRTEPELIMVETTITIKVVHSYDNKSSVLPNTLTQSDML